MKQLTAALALVGLVLFGASCMSIPKNGAAVESSVPAATVPAPAPGEFQTITGTVVKTRLVKGWGFGHWDVGVMIQTAEGQAEFFAADKGLVVLPDGQQTPIKKVRVKLIKDKQVEIKYFIITDAPGGLGKFENGKPGIVTMTVLN